MVHWLLPGKRNTKPTESEQQVTVKRSMNKETGLNYVYTARNATDVLQVVNFTSLLQLVKQDVRQNVNCQVRCQQTCCNLPFLAVYNDLRVS